MKSGITSTGRGTTWFRPQVHLSHFIKAEEYIRHRTTGNDITF